MRIMDSSRTDVPATKPCGRAAAAELAIAASDAAEGASVSMPVTEAARGCEALFCDDRAASRLGCPQHLFQSCLRTESSFFAHAALISLLAWAELRPSDLL